MQNNIKVCNVHSHESNFVKIFMLKKSKVPFKTMNYSNRNHITGDKQKPQVLGLFWSTTIKATVVFFHFA